jgi:hypothetical protein
MLACSLKNAVRKSTFRNEEIITVKGPFKCFKVLLMMMMVQIVVFKILTPCSLVGTSIDISEEHAACIIMGEDCRLKR